MMRSFRLILLFLFLLCNVFAQNGNNVLIVTEDGMKDIPAYIREGTIYFSVKDFADALGINYYYNEDSKKIEVKFDKYLLRTSARNPFIVIVNKESSEQNTFQLSTSTFYINSKVFVPLKASIKIFESAFGADLKFEEPNKIIIGKTKIDIIKTTDKSSADFNISKLMLNEKVNGTLITIKSNKNIQSYKSSFTNNVLTLTFRKVNIDVEKIKVAAGTGVVKNIEAKNVGGDAEVYISVGEEYTRNEVMNIENSNDIQITIHNKIFKKNDASNKLKEKWEFDVIVIDAGHGGKDAGAIGVNGAKEKDINLGIALKLGKLIEENIKDVKVVYTRKTDKFVDLYKRGKIANENNGKLFISIHCNSTPQKPSNANGFEVYLLRPGRTKEAIAIAEFENSVIQLEENPNRYEKLTDENFILVSMAHSSYMKYAEKFAEFLHKEFSDHPSLASRGVKQAGFYVLVGASMPSVLIESGFLSNSNDAKHLTTKKGQEQFAEYVFDAIKKYQLNYELEMQSE